MESFLPFARRGRGEVAETLEARSAQPWEETSSRAKESEFAIFQLCSWDIMVLNSVPSHQWGGRIDTLKLSRQSVIVDQPGGGCEYDPVRSYQFTVNEMYTHYKDSEYGARQRNGNSGRNLSLRRFRELICPCMTNAKQRDTADQIVAEFKQYLRSWDLVIRKDHNVEASILRCSSTECSLHAEGSSKATLYAAASRTTTDCLIYLLCSKVHRNELAVHILDSNTGHNSFAPKKEKQIKINLAVAEAKKVSQNENFKASGSRKSTKLSIVYRNL